MYYCTTFPKLQVNFMQNGRIVMQLSPFFPQVMTSARHEPSPWELGLMKRLRLDHSTLRRPTSRPTSVKPPRRPCPPLFLVKMLRSIHSQGLRLRPRGRSFQMLPPKKLHIFKDKREMSFQTFGKRTFMNALNILGKSFNELNSWLFRTVCTLCTPTDRFWNTS